MQPGPPLCAVGLAAGAQHERVPTSAAAPLGDVVCNCLPMPRYPYLSCAPPARREMSPLEEVLATALGSSQLNLRRLTLMAKEIEQAMEREAKQIERLEFAMQKAQGDVAYYQTLQRMVDDMQRRR